MVALMALLVLLALTAVSMLIDPRHAFETEIMIPAPPESVWDVITDSDAYAEWSVFIEGISGPLEEGETIEVALNSASADYMTFEPTLLVVRPNEELRWLGRVIMPNVFDGEHYFILESVPGGTRFVHGERFDGILIPFFDMDVFEADFERFNAALKARVAALADTSG
jgi:hypothetical protein